MLILSIFSSCKKAEVVEPQKLDNGLYLGLYSNEPGTAVAYKVLNSELSPLNLFDKTEYKMQIIDDHRFLVVVNNGLVNPFVCSKSMIAQNDYQTAVAGTDKEFLGLHFCTSLNITPIKTNTFRGNLFIAISESNISGIYDVVLAELGTVVYEKTIAKVNSIINQRELSFEVSSVITGDNAETWTMTLDPFKNDPEQFFVYKGTREAKNFDLSFATYTINNRKY